MYSYSNVCIMKRSCDATIIVFFFVSSEPITLTKNFITQGRKERFDSFGSRGLQHNMSEKVWGDKPIYFKQPVRVCVNIVIREGF